jgi:putative membrane protein insertion efficiency factor
VTATASEQVQEPSPTGPDHPGARTMGWTARRLRSLVHAYQLARTGRPSGCRFVPSCSEYAVEALEVHGAVRGSALAVKRLIRCHPWGGHGIDPVPDEGVPCSR